MATYNTSKTDVNNKFRGNEYSQEQKDKIKEILEVLRRYVFIDRNILNARNIEPVKLQHIQRARNLGLIVETKDVEALNAINTEVDDKHYFYTLGVAGINILQLDRIKYYCFRLLDTFDQRKKVLIFNYHAIKNDLSLEFSDYNDMNEYNYFICKDRKNHNIVCFHDDCIAKGKIISIMKKKFISKLKTEEDIENKDDLFSDFISKYTFEIIESVETTYVKTLRNEYSLNTQLLDENRFDTETDNSNIKI